MFEQNRYWYNTAYPDKLKYTERVFNFVSRLHHLKYEHINSMIYVDTQDKGKVYHFENEYNLYVDDNNTYVKVILCESFHSYSMFPLEHHSIRGISFIHMKYEIDELKMDDDCKNTLTKFCDKFDERMNAIVESFQREYDSQHFWENPSYSESDGSEPVSESIAHRQIL